MLFKRGRRGSAVRVAQRLGQHAVDHDAAQRHGELSQLRAEKFGLRERGGLQRGHDHEAHLRAAEQAVDVARPRLHAPVQLLQLTHEVGDLLQRVVAEEAVGEAEERHGGKVHGAPETRRSREPREQARTDIVRQAIRCLEEVERVARRRGVHHHHVILAALVQLIERIHGGVLMRPDERVADSLIEAVLQNTVGGAPIGREPLDEPVPRRLRVKHGSNNLALRRKAGAMQLTW